jgi:hypothetical protein
MRVLLGAVAAVGLMASPALAQTQGPASCQNFPAAPTVPDGATASRDEVQSGRDAIAAWDADIQARIAACRADIAALNAAVNAQDTARVTTVNSMAAEIQEFVARGNTSSSNRRERGGVLTRPDN